MKDQSHHQTTSRGQRRRPGRLRLGGTCLGVLGMFVGSAALVATPASAEQEVAKVSATDAAVNARLDALAQTFAGAVTDRDLRRTIHAAAAERFDGDTEALWTTLAAEPGVRTALARTYGSRASVGSRDARAAVGRMADDIPRLQVAVPANFDDWDPDTYAPLVAFMPEGVEDTTLETVTAYDKTGRAVQLDAQVPPTRPVIVLGLNERTDDAGNLRREPQPAPDADALISKASSAEAATSAAVYKVRLRRTHVTKDNEPWTKGSAEIAVRAKSRGCGGTNYTDIDFTGLNNDGDTYTVNRTLGSTTCPVVFYWWEDDGASFDFNLSFKGFGLGVKMDDGDDLIGGVQLRHVSFQGASIAKSAWSDLQMWTD